MVSDSDGRRTFLSSSTAKGLQIPPSQWKPSYPHVHMQVSQNVLLADRSCSAQHISWHGNPTQHLPTSSPTRGSICITYCPVCMKGPNSHSQNPQLGWPKQCPAVQEETRHPRTLQSGQLSVLILEGLLFPSRPSSWNEGITKGRLSSSSASNPQRLFNRQPLAGGICRACRVFLCFHLIFTATLARP